jgi:hypothetical protein
MATRCFRYDEKGNKGLADQVAVLSWLREQGYVLINSSFMEDSQLDIDVWVRKRKQTDPTRPQHIPVSIKCMHDGKKYDNFGVEIDVLCRTETGDYEWTGSSWFQNGQAEQYLVLQGNELFRIVKRELQEAWESGKISPERVRTLKAETVEAQRAIGHPHLDAKTAFFNRTQLRQLGIMKLIGYLDGKPKSYGSVTPSKFKKLSANCESR